MIKQKDDIIKEVQLEVKECESKNKDLVRNYE